MGTRRPSPPLALALFLGVSAALLAALGLAASRPTAVPPDPPAALVPDLNASPARHLLLLPGIGPARARAIVEERAKGPFETVSDLARVRGIGPATAAALASLVHAPERRVREGDP